MSAKNRGTVTVKHAVYPSDPRLVRGLLRAIDAGHGPPLLGLNRAPDPCDPLPIWCDPCANDRAIVRAVESYRAGGRIWMTADIRPEAASLSAGRPTLASIRIARALSFDWRPRTCFTSRRIGYRRIRLSTSAVTLAAISSSHCPGMSRSCR